jgi:hypothetical protein
MIAEPPFDDGHGSKQTRVLSGVVESRGIEARTTLATKTSAAAHLLWPATNSVSQ